MLLRLIIQSSKDGNEEYLHLSNDFESGQDEFKIKGCKIQYDGKCFLTIPNYVNLPLNRDLRVM
jgi:hypothetical protein